MIKVILKLAVAAIIVVLAGWAILTFVNFPGNSANLVKLNNKNYQEVSLTIMDYLKSSSLSDYSVEDLNNASQKYTLAVETLKLNIETNQFKDDFSWDEEKQLAAEMKKVYKLEIEAKNYIETLITYLNSDSTHQQTIENMLYTISTKLTNVAFQYENLQVKFNQNFQTEETPDNSEDNLDSSTESGEDASNN